MCTLIIRMNGKRGGRHDLSAIPPRRREGPDELIRVRGKRQGGEEREGISGMAGDPRCVRVLGPFRQAPTQRGGRDNHAAPDSTHGDGGMDRDEETQRGED